MPRINILSSARALCGSLRSIALPFGLPANTMIRVWLGSRNYALLGHPGVQFGSGSTGPSANMPLNPRSPT